MWPFANLLGFVPLLFVSVRSDLKGSIGPMNHKGSLSLSALFIVTWSTLLEGVEASAKEEAERHLQMGKKFLAQGQLADALTQYHAAIEHDPNNYLNYYSRATVYLAMGKSKSAMPDLDKVLKLKEDFTAARLQRGNVYLKLGKLDEAYIDFERVLSKDPTNFDASEKMNLIEPLKRDLLYAQQLYDAQDYHSAIALLTRGVEICPWDPNIHELRAECYIAVGDYYKAIADIRPTTKLRPDNTAGYFKISKLNYDIGEAEESLTEIRECLKLDPDHKECFPHYKKVKKLVKQMTMVHNFIGEERWDDCLSKVDQMVLTESQNPVYLLRADAHRCHCYSKKGDFDKALETCNKVLSQDEGDIEALCDRADAYLLNELFDDAINDYRKAKDINNEFRRANDGLHRAEKLLKQSKKRDYYKILGVRRNASKKDILKAYRKLAVQWHPDKYDGEDKKKAEKKFIDIASAKEVLTDPEKRQKFDNGEDPLDPEEQANNGPHFHQGFNPFGSGGFQFKFNFG